MKGKKGGGPEDTFTIVFSILLYALILVFFSILMLSKGCNRNSEDIVSKQNTQVELNNFLMGYLRSNVTVEGRQLDIAELIGMYMAEPTKYRAQLENETRGVINNTKGSCFDIQIIFFPAFNDARNLNIESDCLMSQARMTEIDDSASMAIPLQEKLNGVAIINATQRKFV